MHTRRTRLFISCDYPGCDELARTFNDGGFFCELPHRALPSWMSNEPDWAVYVERGGPVASPRTTA